MRTTWGVLLGQRHKGGCMHTTTAWLNPKALIHPSCTGSRGRARHSQRSCRSRHRKGRWWALCGCNAVNATASTTTTTTTTLLLVDGSFDGAVF